MTTQTAVFSGLPTGQPLTAKLFTVAAPDTVAYTADSVTERTNAKGEYVASFGEVAAIIGDHTLILFNGSSPVGIGKRTFAGTDAEEATVTPEVAELDTATQTQIDAIEAVTAGTLSGAGTGTEVCVGSNVTVTVTTPDDAGNRTAVVIT